jgi:hypothetical protein
LSEILREANAEYLKSSRISNGFHDNLHNDNKKYLEKQAQNTDSRNQNQIFFEQFFASGNATFIKNDLRQINALISQTKVQISNESSAVIKEIQSKIEIRSHIYMQKL